MTDAFWPGIEAMKVAKARRTEWLDQRVLDMIEQMVEDPAVMPVHITSGRIARQLGNVPTRQTISKKFATAIQNAQKEKEERIRAVEKRARADDKKPGNGTGSVSAMRSEIKTYQAQLRKMQNEIAKLRKANADLERQRHLALGAQLEGTVLIDPAAHQRVIRDNTQLVDENRKAYAQIRELEKSAKAMHKTLDAQRTANAELLAELAPNDPNKIVTLRPGNGTKKGPSARKRTDDQ